MVKLKRSKALTFFFFSCAVVFCVLGFRMHNARRVGSTAEYLAAKVVLVSKCMSCHASFGKWDEEEWVKSKFIVSGSPERSLLFSKLKNAGGNMPPDGYLSADEAALLRSWILALGEDRKVGTVAGVEVPAAKRFETAKTIIQSKCLSCHGTAVRAQSNARLDQFVPPFGLYVTENEFVVSGLVVPQNYRRSWMYLALNVWKTHFTVSEGASELSAQEKIQINQWIERMGNP